MDIGSIFLILALAVIVGLFIARPLIEPQPATSTIHTSDPQEHNYSTLLAEHDRILNSLQELDFDYALGKIPAADYPEQRATLVIQGTTVLRLLDEYQPQSVVQDTENHLEAAIAAHRAEMSLNAANPNHANNGRKVIETIGQVEDPDDRLETVLANRRRVRQEKSAGFCPHCGTPIQISDKFCPKCGEKLSQVASR